MSAPFTVWESISPALGCGLRPDQVERLVVEYLAGNSLQKLATGWHLHRTTVAEHLRRAGVRSASAESRGPTRRSYRLYSDGWSCSRFAEYSWDDETARQTRRPAGVKLRTPWER